MTAKKKTRGHRPGRRLKRRAILEAMEAGQITKADLAKKLRVTPEAISNTLRPGQRVSLERALEYAKAVGLRLDDVVDLGY